LICAVFVTGTAPALAAAQPQAEQAAAATTHTRPNTSRCPTKVAPPHAVDTSEKQRPGAVKISALPVPATPAGGARMAECGYVLPKSAPALPQRLGFESWALTDLDAGTVLAAKDPHGRERPASIIKTLLAIVVLRDLDLSTVIKGTKEDANAPGTRVGIGVGGTYTLDQVLHGLLMKSGNDCAHALAMRLGGPQMAVQKMNEVARGLGALDTRAATPSGLDGPGMSTSAYDMSLILRKALSDPRFAKIIATKRTRFPGFAKHKAFDIANDNQLLGTYPGDLGGKTGFTDDAQHTFLTVARRGGHRIALVMLHGTDKLDGMYRDAPALMNYGFALVARKTAPVGELVERSETAATTPAHPAATTGHTSAGTTGGSGDRLVAGVAALAVLLGVGVFWRRSRSRKS
jgi:D-alanyl-D-alanine carboxypeptidase (penicillin-binding protein 5/6)